MDLKEMQESVQQVLPPECLLTKIEFEGPQIVIYVKNIQAFYSDEHLITKIASKVRKKVLLRVDASELMPPSRALDKVKSTIPPEAGVQDIKFDPIFHEVVIDYDS